MATTTCAMAPVNRFWTPSSCSIIASARFSASSLIAASGGMMGVASWLIVPKRKSPAGRGFSGRRSLLDLDALLRVVLERAGVVRNRRRRGLLVLEAEVLGFLVDAHQLVLVL